MLKAVESVLTKIPKYAGFTNTTSIDLSKTVPASTVYAVGLPETHSHLVFCDSVSQEMAKTVRILHGSMLCVIPPDYHTTFGKVYFHMGICLWYLSPRDVAFLSIKREDLPDLSGVELEYSGELGYFMIGVYPLLDYLVRTKVTIKTYDAYALIAQLACPKLKVKGGLPFNPSRNCNAFSQRSRRGTVSKPALWSFLLPYLELLPNQGRMDMSILTALAPKTALPIPYPVRRKFITIFPRKRKLPGHSTRNIPGIFWETIVKTINSTSAPNDFEIIVVGHPEEILDEFKEPLKSKHPLFSTIPIIHDFGEQLDVFANSVLFITPDTGLVEVAKVCGVDDILIVTMRRSVSPIVTGFNPLNAKLEGYSICAEARSSFPYTTRKIIDKLTAKAKPES